MSKPCQANYMLQDANYNVVGIANENGDPARQYVYDPYGQLLVEDIFLPLIANRVGHQGLFADRIRHLARGCIIITG